MFKLRPRGQGPSGPSQPPTIETVRRRARHRLIGATVLVVAGIVGFSLLFDAQPRPVQVDVAIEIPSRDQAAPLPLPVPAPDDPPVSAPVAAEDRRVAAPAEVLEPAGAAPSAPASVTQPPAPSAPVPSKAPVAPAPAPAPAPARSPAPASAPARTAAPSAPAAPASARVVVQVGAYADARRAQEVRNRLERAGLKTYAQVAQTAEGPRTRVRLGPFDSRAEAERAAERVKALDLPAVILTL